MNVIGIIQVLLSGIIAFLIIWFRFWINPKLKIMERMGRIYKIFFEVTEQGVKILEKERETLKSKIVIFEKEMENSPNRNADVYKRKYNSMMDHYLELEDKFFDLMKRFNAISAEDYHSQRTRETIEMTFKKLLDMEYDLDITASGTRESKSNGKLKQP